MEILLMLGPGPSVLWPVAPSGARSIPGDRCPRLQARPGGPRGRRSTQGAPVQRRQTAHCLRYTSAPMQVDRGVSPRQADRAVCSRPRPDHGCGGADRRTHRQHPGDRGDRSRSTGDRPRAGGGAGPRATCDPNSNEERLRSRLNSSPGLRWDLRWPESCRREARDPDQQRHPGDGDFQRRRGSALRRSTRDPPEDGSRAGGEFDGRFWNVSVKRDGLPQ